MQYLLTQSEFEEYQRLKFQHNLTGATERSYGIKLLALWTAVEKGIREDRDRQTVLDLYEADLEARRLAAIQEGQPKQEEPKKEFLLAKEGPISSSEVYKTGIMDVG